MSMFTIFRIFAVVIFCLTGFLTCLCALFYSWILPPRIFIVRKLRVYSSSLLYSTLLLLCNVRVSVHLTDDIVAPANAATVYMGPHGSNLDSLLIQLIYWLYREDVVGPIVGIAKKSLLFVPLIGQSLFFGGHITVTRSHNERLASSSLSVAEDRLREGYSVGIFPEGTRRRSASVGPEHVQPFKKGGFHMVLNLVKSGTPVHIVPLIFFGGFGSWPKHSAFPTPGSLVSVRVGRHLVVSETDSIDSLMKRTKESIQCEMNDSINKKYNSNLIFKNGIEIHLLKCLWFYVTVTSIPSVAVILFALCGYL